MAKRGQDNFAYIDGANLYRGINSFGWKLDYARFRVWLSEKYGVNRAYIFIGLIPKYKDLYVYLQETGFTHTKNLCSILLKRTNAPIAYLSDQKSILQVRKEKAPDADKTA